MPFERKNLVLSSAVLGLLIPMLLSGCEFGNKSRTQLTGYDTISGYYSTLPQTIAFRAQVGNTAERTLNGTVTQMPLYLKTILANPTMIYYDDPVGHVGSIRAHADTTLGFATKIEDATSTFGVSTGAYAEVGGCRFEQEIDHSGSFAQSPVTTVVAGLTVRGTLSIDYAIRYFFIGDDIDCDAMRATFKTCYMDDVGCSSNSGSIYYRPFVDQIFGPLVNSGIMTDAEIASVRSLGYSATYR